MTEPQDSKPIRQFTDLLAWREAHKLVLMLYAEVKNFPKEELYSLTNQMKRAVVSITSNIAEGFGRQGYKEKVQFYYLAQGSLTELKNQIFIARDICYISSQRASELLEQADTAHRLLQGLIRKSKEILGS